MIDRSDAPVNHIIRSIGTSSLEKGDDFVAKYCPKQSPKVYDTYHGVYNDPDVDIVYIGTPHAFHKQNCLDAIAAGKNVFCEKAFTINQEEAKEVFEAAKQKGVYVQEAMWLRHRPLVHQLRKLLFEEKVIGNVIRTFSNFYLDVDISSLPESSRYKSLDLGAGTLLDTGLYSLTWAMLTLDAGLPKSPEAPTVHAIQTHQTGIEVMSSVLLFYPSTGRQGIITSTTMCDGMFGTVARIEGSNGYVEVHGNAPSFPTSFTVYPKFDSKVAKDQQPKGDHYDFPKVGRGFTWEADSCALDVLAGKKESDVVPQAETLRVMGILDEIRRQGATVYPADQK